MRGPGRIKQGKLVARRRRRFFYLSFYALVLAGLIICLFSYISGLQTFLVGDVVVSGNTRLSYAELQNIGLRNLEGTYLYLFPRANTFIYPKGDIEREVLALPLVKTVVVERYNMRTVSLEVTERETEAVWCDEDVDNSYGSSSDCYSVDENGFIFASRSRYDEGFIYESELASSSEPIGQRVTSVSDFKKIQFFMTELAKLSVEPERVTLTASSTYMNVRLAGGGKLVVNTADDLSTVLGNISAIISDKSVAPDLAKFLSRLDYMKLDVGNKVVFKLK